MITEMLHKISNVTMKSEQVTEDIVLLQFTIVNACLVGSKDGFVLVDTGMENSADFILKEVAERFGRNTKPKAIILTHGHFDHVGSVINLANHWNIPVYAHQLELPYLTGKKDYPQGDSTVDGGLVSEMSSAFPHKALNLGDKIHSLPQDGTVPGMPEWTWIHTPGHTEGHISLFRDRDRTVIAADAFCTLKQESLFSVLSQEEQISGPPKYLTTDWKAAEQSVKKIAELKPALAIVSHGLPMKGEKLREHLLMLVNDFKEIAVPEQGRFVK
ncbi:MBL fold metallo-hydrolase [Clostridium sp. A1-XYC3]|uniref:MBL fold metallo-hydrolase n=1 Tax=Clostridium tanneri TaxID=3037988 RepID=A0ABU4JS58_9CLOT|nr:MBL fold metallo-hydrolase [Clostridium sp. A1-XYC3]MDW8800980.1 MBL fold metallo-hydrolase [Clostridium sp. A1-XYC3]